MNFSNFSCLTFLTENFSVPPDQKIPQMGKNVSIPLSFRLLTLIISSKNKIRQLHKNYKFFSNIVFLTRITYHSKTPVFATN